MRHNVARGPIKTNVIEQYRDEMATLCRPKGAKRLDVFGSAIRADFNPASRGLDFLVEFDDLPPARYADAHFALNIRFAWRHFVGHDPERYS